MKRKKLKRKLSGKQRDSANDEVTTTEFFPSSTPTSYGSSMSGETDAYHEEEDVQHESFGAYEDDTGPDDCSDLNLTRKLILPSKSAEVDKITVDEFKNCEKAFVKVYEFYLKPLIAYATTILRKVADGEDVVHDVIFNLFEKRKRLSIKSIREFLFRIVRNRCLDFLKHKNHKHTPVAYDESMSNVCDENNDPQTLLEAKETEIIIEDTIAAFPEQRRTIFLMHRDEGLKNNEIACILNISEGTVAAQINRARAKLKEALGKNRRK